VRQAERSREVRRHPHVRLPRGAHRVTVGGHAGRPQHGEAEARVTSSRERALDRHVESRQRAARERGRSQPLLRVDTPRRQRDGAAARQRPNAGSQRAIAHGPSQREQRADSQRIRLVEARQQAQYEHRVAHQAPAARRVADEQRQRSQWRSDQLHLVERQVSANGRARPLDPARLGPALGQQSGAHHGCAVRQHRQPVEERNLPRRLIQIAARRRHRLPVADGRQSDPARRRHPAARGL
jgi:hypothetical protein